MEGIIIVYSSFSRATEEEKWVFSGGGGKRKRERARVEGKMPQRRGGRRITRGFCFHSNPRNSNLTLITAASFLPRDFDCLLSEMMISCPLHFHNRNDRRCFRPPTNPIANGHSASFALHSNDLKRKKRNKRLTGGASTGRMLAPTLLLPSPKILSFLLSLYVCSSAPGLA